MSADFEARAQTQAGLNELDQAGGWSSASESSSSYLVITVRFHSPLARQLVGLESIGFMNKCSTVE